jgi:hypothetical protein
VPNKHGYPTARRPAAFVDAPRADGWVPRPVPEGVVSSSARFEMYLAVHPGRIPNHVLGTGPVQTSQRDRQAWLAGTRMLFKKRKLKDKSAQHLGL